MQGKRCIGCGSPLQTEYIDKAGFVKSLEQDYCVRCFRLNHYNEMPKILANPEDYDKILSQALNKNGLIVLIVDVFDISATFIPKILDYIRGKDVIVVANKFDILPKSTNVGRVVEWMSKTAQKMFFKALAFHVVSSKKGYFLDDLMNTIDMMRMERDVYFVGCANVGKSSLINALLKRFTPETDDIISSSPIPGTTLDLIKIPFFEDNKAFIDTPGLINKGNILNQLLPVSYKRILPQSEIKPITYQIKNDNSVFIGGMACISILESDNLSATFYFSKNLLIHRTKTENVDYLIKNHLGEMLNPPTEEEKDGIKYEIKEFNITDKLNELFISGLGFVSFNKPCKIRLRYIKDTDVTLRNGIIGK